MARFYGPVGYASDQVEEPSDSGVWVDQIVEFQYFGDVERASRNLVNAEKLNVDLSLGNVVSIVADQYAFDNYANIRYVTLDGSDWVVSSVEVERPRLILRLGEVYNGPKPTESP